MELAKLVEGCMSSGTVFGSLNELNYLVAECYIFASRGNMESNHMSGKVTWS